MKQPEDYIGRKVTDSISQAGNWLEFTLEKLERGSATLSLTVRPEMTNPYGNIHGGMMSLVVDECIGWAVVSLRNEHNYTSMDLKVDFLYAIKGGERLRAVSEVIREGKKIINVDCRVYDMDGRILAKASSNLIATGMVKQGDGGTSR